MSVLLYFTWKDQRVQQYCSYVCNCHNVSSGIVTELWWDSYRTIRIAKSSFTEQVINRFSSKKTIHYFVEYICLHINKWKIQWNTENTAISFVWKTLGFNLCYIHMWLGMRKAGLCEQNTPFYILVGISLSEYITQNL